MTESTAAQASADAQLVASAVWEEVAVLDDQVITMRGLANDARLVALSSYSTLYREVRQGYLDAENTLLQTIERVKLLQTMDRIEAKSHD
ncbi:hypothetical protein [Brevibacterium sediminis]